MTHTTIKLTAGQVELLAKLVYQASTMELYDHDRDAPVLDKLYDRLDRARRRLADKPVPVSAPPAPATDEPTHAEYPHEAGCTCEEHCAHCNGTNNTPCPKHDSTPADTAEPVQPDSARSAHSWL